MGNASVKMEAGVTSAEVSSLGRPAETGSTTTPTTAASTAPSPLRRMHHFCYFYYYYYYQVHSQLYINATL